MCGPSRFTDLEQALDKINEVDERRAELNKIMLAIIQTAQDQGVRLINDDNDDYKL